MEQMEFELCGELEDPNFNILDKSMIYEVKYDGIRIAWFRDRFINRNQNDVTKQFPEIHPEFNGVLDGEIVVFNGENGFKTDFELIQGRSQSIKEDLIEMNAKMKPATFVVFDVLEYNGEDLRTKPLIERKKYLEFVKGERVQVAPWYVGEGKKLFEWAKELGLEGLIAKPLDATYHPNSRNYWMKIKNRAEGVFKILSYKTTKGKLHGGFVIFVDTKTKRPQNVAVQGLIDRDTIRRLLEEGREVYAEVEFLQRTSSGRLRMPTFKGIKKV